MMLSKSKPTYVYPLKYEKTFAWNLEESIVSTGLFGCDGNLNDYEPTCGWQYDYAG